MPSIINAATSGGLISTADTSGVLQLQTASTTAMTIDASQNVGIGTTNPDNNANYKTLTITGSTTTTGGVIGFKSSNGSAFAQIFNDSTSFALKNNSATPTTIFTSGLERMRVNAGAPILCLAGGNTSATGTGIAFPATQSASSDVNTLDDYEEGSFTPTVTAASGSNGGGTFDGSYIKIGRYVYTTLRCQSVSKGTLSGQIQVGGLPFPVNVVNSTATCRYELSGAPAAGTTIICPQSGGGTGMELQMFGNAGYLGNLAASNLGATFGFYNITYSYITDN
jgi:hypothetical protein